MEEHHGMCKNVGYDAKRASVQVLWGGLCAAIQGGCAMVDGTMLYSTLLCFALQNYAILCCSIVYCTIF
jgi:hypothetical protein